MLISISKPNLNSLSFIIFIIIRILRDYKEKILGEDDYINYELSTFIYFYMCYFSELLDLIPDIISNKKRKRKNTEKKQSSSKLNEKSSKLKKVGIKKKYRKYILFLFLMTIIDFISNLIYNMKRNNATSLSGNIRNFLGILVSILFCRLLLNYRIFRHNILALIIIIIGLSTFAETIIEDFDYVEFIRIVISVSLDSIYRVLSKYLMIKSNFLTFYSILAYSGAIGLLYNIILSIIFMFIPCNKGLKIFFNCDEGSKVFKWSEFIIFYTKWKYFGQLVYNIFTFFIFTNTVFFILKNYSPYHVQIAYYYSFAVEHIIDLIIGANTNNRHWYNYIGIIVILIGCLIYNEVIILHFCGMDENTKDEIYKRAKEDANMSRELEMEEDINNDYKRESYSNRYSERYTGESLY